MAAGAFHARPCAAQSPRRYGNGGLALWAARTMAAPLLSAALCGLRGGRAFGTAGETRAGETRSPASGGRLGWRGGSFWAPGFPKRS